MPHTPLHEAAKGSDYEKCLEMISDHSVDINARDNSWVCITSSIYIDCLLLAMLKD